MPNFLKNYINGEIKRSQKRNINGSQKKKSVNYIKFVNDSKNRFGITQLLQIISEIPSLTASKG
jgi:hypothetical protein